MLSEIATGKRGRKVVALVNVRRAYFNAPARRKVFVELPPEDQQPGDEHMCGLLRHSLCCTRDAAENWEEQLASTLSDLKLTRGSACPCVSRGCIKGEDVVTTVHGDDTKIGGERSAVELLNKMVARKFEIKKQVIGEDPDLGKSGTMLNRVIEWDRDGITIEADQRHVREILKDLELEPANQSATPCAVERRDERAARNDRSKGEYPDDDWGGDKATSRSVSAGVIMRGGHCLEVWTKTQQVVSLSSAESELHAAVQTASEGLGIQRVAKDLWIS